MVTGAGGSIGSELCRQIIGLGPEAAGAVRDVRARALQHRTGAAHGRGANIHCTSISSASSATPITSFACATFFMAYRVQTVYHAAAYKHVPIVEQNVDRGHLQQRHRDLVCGRGRSRDRGRDLRAGVDRQGGESHQCHGRDQAICRDGAAGPASARQQDAVLHGAVRQRAGLLGLGRAAVQRADQSGRPGHRDPSRSDPLLHDHSGGGAARDPGRLHGGRRRCIRARHGQARADLRSGAAHDPSHGA